LKCFEWILEIALSELQDAEKKRFVGKLHRGKFDQCSD